MEASLDFLLFLAQIFVGVICAFTGAAAMVRARNLGASITGACFLACLCGAIVPTISTMYFFRNSGGIDFAFSIPPMGAFIGAMAALGALAVVKKGRPALFFWLDSLSMALLGVVATVAVPLVAGPGLGLVASLIIGIICGTIPTIARDVVLGDTAMAVERDWYVSALAIGCISALILEILLGNKMDIITAKLAAGLGGIAVVIFLRRFRGYNLD